jgi:hypothetical protein
MKKVEQCGKPMSRKIGLFLVALMLLWLGRLVWDYYDPNSPTNLAMQVQLKIFGTVMYALGSLADQTGRPRADITSDTEPCLAADREHNCVPLAAELET